jgi:catechol 2,3-dioxygenase-like lactoylglutathione lyase family enzyme
MFRISSAMTMALVLAGPLPRASAQLLVAGDGPVVYGHHHVNASSLEDHKRFWIDALGGTLGHFGANRLEIVKFPNALLFMREQAPTGGTKGTTVDHIAFSVPDLRAVVDRLRKGGYRMVSESEAPPNVRVVDDIGIVEGDGPVSGIAYVLGPDEVKVELLEMRAQTAPVVSHHVHFFSHQNAEMRDWYMKVFGAEERPSANPAAFVSAGLPGLGMNFSPADAPMAGTQGRALDHVGFEVQGLEAFTKRLEAQGIELVVPYRSVPALGLSIAFIRDPWGTYIELTEGLDSIE